MACLAAFAALLGRYAGSDDVQIGSGLANRRDPAAERLVGMLVATRWRCGSTSAATRPCASCCGGCGTRWWERWSNADVPFDRVVETLAPPAPGRPLAAGADAVLLRRRAGRPPVLVRAWRRTSYHAVSNGTAKADLNVIGVDHGDDPPFFIWEHSDSSPTPPSTASPPSTRPCSSSSSPIPTPASPSWSWRARRSGSSCAPGAPAPASTTARRRSRGWSSARRGAIPRRWPRSSPARRLSYGELLARARAIAGSLRAARASSPATGSASLLPRSLRRGRRPARRPRRRRRLRAARPPAPGGADRPRARRRRARSCSARRARRHRRSTIAPGVAAAASRASLEARGRRRSRGSRHARTTPPARPASRRA